MKISLFHKQPAADYVVVDLETTGTNVHNCEIIEIGALKVLNGKITDTFHSLVKAHNKIDPAASEINGIYDKDLVGAPELKKVLPKFLKFIGDSTLVGYNINRFDALLLRHVSAETLGVQLKNNCIDILPLAIRKLPQLTNHRLSTVAGYFCIDTSEIHHAVCDCEIEKHCYEKLLEYPDPEPVNADNRSRTYRNSRKKETMRLQDLQSVIQGILEDNAIDDDEVIYLHDWMDHNRELEGNYPYDKVFELVRNILEDGVIEQSEIDELFNALQEYMNPYGDSGFTIEFEGKNFVLTGDFSFGEKSIVESAIVERGGIIKSGVSKKVNYVVVGDLGSPNWSYGNYGSKVKKAKELQGSGVLIEIIPEKTLVNSFSHIQSAGID